jgi:hypothetical protein
MDEPAFISIRSEGTKTSTNVPVRVIGRSGDKYRCRLLIDARLPGKSWGLEGEVVMVPAYAVRFEHLQPEQLTMPWKGE